MPPLTITESRAALLRAIASGQVTEFWNDNDQPGDITHAEYPGRRTRVTGKVRVMKTVGLCETDPADADLHTRRIRLTDAGQKALAEHDAKPTNGRPKLKVYSLGIHGFIQPDVNAALGIAPHIRQAQVLAAATTKSHAVEVYREHGFNRVTLSDSEFRTAMGGDIDPLTEAGLFTEPGVWVLPFLVGRSGVVVRMGHGGVPQRVGRLETADGNRLVYVPEEPA